MKILDKYIAKNFLTGYCISFAVLIGLRVVIDLFVNLDQFTEHAQLGTPAVMANIARFYGAQITLYFRDFAGMITVVAAAFSLGKLVKNNELVAMMASGVSLKRVIAPIVFLAMIFTAVLVINQEVLIPALSNELVRRHDSLPGQETYDVRFIHDRHGSLIMAKQFDVRTQTLQEPTVITRTRREGSVIWDVTGRIDADLAVFNEQTGAWELVNGYLSPKGPGAARQPVETYRSDITPANLPVRRAADNKTLLSSAQIAELARQQTQVKDQAQLYSQKHFRITEPLINLVMLMISLPILVCRDPKAMKSAVVISFTVTSACLVITFFCKMLATEAVFARMMPEVWAWLPIFIFLPIAFIEIDAMKT